MIKAVIFDIDGTLVDSVDFHARAWREAFLRFGKDIPLDQVRSQIGKGGDQLMPVFLSPDELDRFGKDLEKLRAEIYKTEYLPKVQPFRGVRELFQCLKRDGRKIALASSAPEDELQYYKKLLRIEDLIDENTSADDAERSKPHPDIFAAAIAKLTNVNAEESLVVGDSPYDAEAARKLGTPAIGVLCGGFPPPELLNAGARAVYRDPEELLDIYPAWVN